VILNAMPPSLHAQRVTSRVRHELRARRISQEELAAAIGISQQAVSRRLTGDVDFTLTELGIVAEQLGTSIADLTAEPGEKAS
jgi:transcriptional regulator with XRE-family HTH domain